MVVKGTEFGIDPAAYEAQRTDWVNGLGGVVMEHCLQHAGLNVGDVVLEIGPGIGNSTRRLLEAGVSVVGIDPDERMLDYARDHALQGRVSENVDDFLWAHNRFSEAAGGVALLLNASFGKGYEQLEEIAVKLGGFDGAAAFTSIHWVRRELGWEPGLKMVADVLDDDAPMMFAHMPHHILATEMAGGVLAEPGVDIVESQRQFACRMKEVWPKDYLKDISPEKRGRLPFVEDIPFLDVSPHFSDIPGGNMASAVAERLTAQELIDDMDTYGENLVLDGPVRHAFYERIRRIVDNEFGGHVLVGVGATAQVVRRAQPD